MPANPIYSSTVILLRDGSDGIEVILLVRQAKEGDPFSGASVFPGGVVDDQDAETRLPESIDLLTFGAALGGEVPPPLVHGLLIAACRELFEESGILLARDSSDRVVDPETVQKLDPQRRGLQERSHAFAEILSPYDLHPDPSGLVPFAHWITPEAQPRRWNTHFFIGQSPEGQEGSCDGRETAHAEWMTPDAAVRAYSKGSITLAPPTLSVLGDLSEYRDVATAITAARQNGPPSTILPVPLRGAPVPTLLYPGDSKYPGHTGPAAQNRVVLAGARWRRERS